VKYKEEDMPGNTIKINNADALEWYVGDNKMDELMEWLQENAIKTEQSNVVDFTPVKSKMDLLIEWLDELLYPGKSEDFIQIGLDAQLSDNLEMKVRIYTEVNQYEIKGVDRKEDDGYLGCGVKARKPRAGEDWDRGNDLPDGPFTRETWNKILNAMINYELVPLTKFTRPTTLPEEVA